MPPSSSRSASVGARAASVRSTSGTPSAPSTSPRRGFRQRRAAGKRGALTPCSFSVTCPPRPRERTAREGRQSQLRRSVAWGRRASRTRSTRRAMRKRSLRMGMIPLERTRTRSPRVGLAGRRLRRPRRAPLCLRWRRALPSPRRMRRCSPRRARRPLRIHTRSTSCGRRSCAKGRCGPRREQRCRASLSAPSRSSSRRAPKTLSRSRSWRRRTPTCNGSSRS
mmetsp:Transcript_9598/g.32529  ORF Transcript_9598/g.32529 Transcript_9598/m.32529 type:complete len:223 (-) Transcript_9598:151-819(-)